MSNWFVAVVIGAVFGLVIGIRIAHASDGKQPVRGGLVGHVLHYLACAGMSSTVPFIVAGIVIGLAFLKLVVTAVGLLAVTFGLLLVYALIERSAPPLPDAGPVLSE